MKYESVFNQINARIITQKEALEKLNSEYKNCVTEFKKASQFTEKFLKECAKKGITRIAIQEYDNDLKSCKNWPFEYDNNVFTNEAKTSEWPAIWGVLKKFGIDGGCGNSMQHNLNEKGQALLVDGVYQLKAGKWLKVK